MIIAATFHFPPSEIWPMDSAELDWWADKAQEIHDAQAKAGSRE